MSAIPSKLIMLRTLANVPISEYADIRPPKDCSNTEERMNFLKRLRQKPKSQSQNREAKARTLSFNAAVWMNFPKAMQKPVSLWLSYKDAKGENTILVDEQTMNDSRSAMLSGTVTFAVKGDIEYFRACCGGISNEERFSIEEIHVRRQETLSMAELNLSARMAS